MNQDQGAGQFVTYFGNQWLYWRGGGFFSSTSVYPGFSAVAVSARRVSGGLICKAKMDLPSSLRKEREEGATPLSHLTILASYFLISFCSFAAVCFLYHFTSLPVGFTDAPHPLTVNLLI
jgi:hypothetical protein